MIKSMGVKQVINALSVSLPSEPVYVSLVEKGETKCRWFAIEDIDIADPISLCLHSIPVSE